MRMIALCGSDESFDAESMWGNPLNPLPPACPACGFPDMDFVPQPYFLKRSAARTSVEKFEAAHGNILVKERVKRVIELLASSDCTFHPTTITKSKEAAPWWLMVPKHGLTTGKIKDSIASCAECGQPVSGHGTQYEVSLRDQPKVFLESTGDIAKTANWFSSERGWRVWVQQQNKWYYSLSRGPFMSIRLFNLLGRMGVRGMDELGLQTEETRPSKDELEWIETGLRRLEEAGIPGRPDETISKEDAAWHRKFLKERGREIAKPDFRAFEKRHGVQLPPSYCKTLEKCGSMGFQDVDGDEGATVRLVPLDEVDAVSMRLGIANFDDKESKAVDCVIFATAENGDNYCFDAANKNAEKPVHRYKHEGHFLEPYASHFVECLRRFTGK